MKRDTKLEIACKGNVIAKEKEKKDNFKKGVKCGPYIFYAELKYKT